jgi:hypothetical protein
MRQAPPYQMSSVRANFQPGASAARPTALDGVARWSRFSGDLHQTLGFRNLGRSFQFLGKLFRPFGSGSGDNTVHERTSLDADATMKLFGQILIGLAIAGPGALMAGAAHIGLLLW